MTASTLPNRAKELDAADPLADLRELFIGHNDPSVSAYLDGNSLGRPLTATLDRISEFIHNAWGGRLIRGWDEGWLALPAAVGDQLGATVLGAASGQCIVADSTTVLLYKLARAAVAAGSGRTEIVLDRDNFPTDRYVMDGIARECGLTLRWVDAAYDGGVSPEAVAAAVGPQTALVVLSHVAYRSGFIADIPAITALVQAVGGRVLWDLSHSAGSVPAELDAWNVDYAAGCSYKYLGGGPGAPAWAYVARRHQEDFAQPIQGWLGASDPFAMGADYVPAAGVQRVASGTPPILGMLAMQDMAALIERVGIRAVRAKSVALTSFAVEAVDEMLSNYGVVLASPRDPDLRGSHITIDHPAFKDITARLWKRGIIPDYRNPDGIRLGLSPLSTSFSETWTGIEAIAGELQHHS